MKTAMITSMAVGFSTVLGALLGLCFKKLPHKYNDVVLGFAAGIMLSAAVIGLILPSIEEGGKYGIFICAAGILCGALFLNFADRFTPHLHNVLGIDTEKHAPGGADKIALFVIAIALHNFPEGLASGVGFGTDNISAAITVAAGIALQNIPEGMIVTTTLLTAGVNRWRAFLIGSFTGLVEIIGSLIGYFTVSLASAVLPFALAFAGGTMLYVISDEMIPETHSHGYERSATYSLIIGFIVMLLLDHFIS